ncbi:MAG TPA: VanZ family protein [Desulfatiglandales bacterium]|nr:VanZ family protein [Desulfatiglandales bacterium]
MNYLYTILAILWTALILHVSSIPSQSFPGSGSITEQIISNLTHIPEYAILTFLWLKVFLKENKRKLPKTYLLIIIGLAVFAVSDEIHQSFVLGRSASFMDIGLDAIGIFFGFKSIQFLDGIYRINRIK